MMESCVSELHETVAGNDGICELDEQTLHKTPFPRAASTSLRKDVPKNERVKDLVSFLNSEMEESGQSSYGLIPCNLILDSSNFNISSSIINKSRKMSGLPSIPESPKHSNGTPSLPTEVNEDDVFVADDSSPKAVNRVSVVSGDGVSMKSSLNLPDAKFSISDLSHIDFRDDQISARSSVAESCSQQSRDIKDNETSMPSTFSKLFSRHSLDVSAFTTPLPLLPQGNAIDTKKLVPIVQLQKDDSTNVEILTDTSCSNPPKAMTDAPESTSDKVKEDLKFFYNLGDIRHSLNGDSNNGEEFIQGGDFIAELEKDEHILEKNNFLLIPQQSGNGSHEDEMDRMLGMALGSSWIANVNRQDITRPSWFTDDEASRISIGKFISARTENLGKWDDDVSKVEDGPDFGIQASLPRYNAMDSVLPHSATAELLPNAVSKKSEVETQKVEPKNLNKKDNVLSHSAISLLLAEASMNADPNELAELVVAASLNKRKDCQEPSSAASDMSVEVGIENATKLIAGVRMLQQSLPSKKEDKVVQVSMESSQLPSVPTVQYSSPTPPPSNIALFNTKPAIVASLNVSQPQNAVLLRPLQADVNDSKPSVLLPDELVIEESCCVGVSIESSLKVQNTSSRWLEANVSIHKITCNGQTWNVEAMPSVIRLNTFTILEPHVVYYHKVVFIPPKEGHWEASLQLNFRNLSPMSKLTTNPSLFDWCSYPIINFRANAENPNLRAIPNDVLDFGVLPEDCLTICHLQLLNNGRANLPIRLVIEGSPGSGQGFYFPNSSYTSSSAMQILSSCLVSCTLSPANYYSAKIPVAFKAQILPHTDDMLTVSASLRIELDTPTPLPMLLKLSLKAVVGVVKLYCRPEDELVELQYPSMATRSLPLRNAGAIPLGLEFSMLDSQQLTVTPANVNLPPGDQVNLQLAYNPMNFLDSLQSCLQIKVLPGGPTYKIEIRASARPVLPQVSAVTGDKLVLHSDHRYLYWGAVGVGQAVIQHFTLRNVCTAENLHLSLKIKADEGCENACPFLMVDSITNLGTALLNPLAIAGPLSTHKLVLQRFIAMNPGEELTIRIYFAPVQAVAYSAKLIIRPRRPTQQTAIPVSPWIKFSIPLRGYGGQAALEYEDLRSTDVQAPLSLQVPNSTGPPVVITSLTHSAIKTVVGRTDPRQFSFTVRNCGQQMAFVKIIPSNDKHAITPLPSWISLDIKSSEFVVAEGQTHVVKIIVNAQSQSSTFFLIIFYGEEILRQRFRLLPLPVSSIPDDTVLRNVLRLHETFPNEIPFRSNTVDSLWPVCQADRSKLVSSLKTTLVMVQPLVHSPNEVQPATSHIPCLGSVLDENLNDRFAPLAAEDTFSDVTLLPSRMVPTSPPIKEKSPLTARGEGLIQLEPTNVVFPRTACGHSSTVKVTLKNVHYGQNLEVTILKPANPFHVNHSQVVIKPKHYLSLPVAFRPTEAGSFSATLLFYPNAGPNPVTLAVSLRGEGT